MPRPQTTTSGLGRANEPSVLILTSLASGAKHGYALTKDIAGFAGVELGPGTLYGAITRLEARALIEPTEGDERRRPYRITASGRAALAEAVHDMRSIADEGALRLGLRAVARAVTNTVSPSPGLSGRGDQCGQ
jgi:DNA-binding PadR family transcriptional regulator